VVRQLPDASGLLGIDYSQVAADVNLDNLNGDAAVKGLTGMFSMVDPNKKWTLNARKDFMAVGGVFPAVVGGPLSIADQLEEWMDYYDLDGFNLHVPMHSGSYTDLVNLVVPELQQRGQLHTSYEGSTLREHFFGVGRNRLGASHPAKQV
jgi:alkanesulfonate monooxygenase SsuD/methylene tetrahydromethanopterin reductase-like flavin-dependent oxidoreductase (luciferase family)